MPDRIQTLHCQHGDGHEWTRPAQRGKPPKRCPEHSAQNSRPTPEAGQASRTESESNRGSAGSASGNGGGNQASGESTGATAQQNPFVLKAQRAQQEAERQKMAALREAKARKSEERSAEELENMRKELETIDERIEETSKAYSEALAAAVKVASVGKDFDTAWNRADSKQDATIRLLNRKKFIKSRLDNPILMVAVDPTGETGVTVATLQEDGAIEIVGAA